MKYMLMMHTPHDGYTQFVRWPKEVIDANTAFMQSFSQRLAAAGELVGAEGLASPQQAKRVRADRHGRPITDGVFPESKEFLAGYWIIDVESPERAYALAAEVMNAPHGPVTGGNGETFDFAIEVREIMGGPPELE